MNSLKGEQTVILVDDRDRILGYAPRNKCHKGRGKRHRAFVIFLYNKTKMILLQKRKHKLWDNFWDVTAASHPLRIGKSNESYLQATARCLKDEWGIDKMKLKKIGTFRYFEKQKNYCENEYCSLFVGEYNGKLSIDPKYVYDFKWISLKQVLSEVKENPEAFTPWFRHAIKILSNNIYFSRRC